MKPVPDDSRDLRRDRRVSGSDGIGDESTPANRHSDHHPHHGHAQHGHHGHHHPLPSPHGAQQRAFAIAVILNAGFVAVEFTWGAIAQSTALMADAGHNLSDVLALLLAWGAATLGRRQPSGRYTYGLRSTTILAALFNALLLIGACGAIAYESMHRLFAPQPVAGLTVTLVALAGIAVNGFSAWLFTRGDRRDVNLRGAYLHLMADAAVSTAVMVAGLLMLFTGWWWVDPVLSLLIMAFILRGTLGLLREALTLAVNAVPVHVDLEAVHAWLASQEGVDRVEDLHVWGMSTTETALTVTLVMPEGASDAFLDHVESDLERHFAIGHATVCVRRSRRPAGEACTL